MEKILKSSYTIRFSDCDLFGHLNNARYIDYILNAREDHLKSYYNLDLRTFHQQGLSWFVGGHEIVYLKPALYNEQVTIQSSLIAAGEDYLVMEAVMFNEPETHIKAICRTRFIPINVTTGRKENHPSQFMNEFVAGALVEGIDATESLRERINFLLSQLKLQKASTPGV